MTLGRNQELQWDPSIHNSAMDLWNTTDVKGSAVKIRILFAIFGVTVYPCFAKGKSLYNFIFTVQPGKGVFVSHRFFLKHQLIFILR